MRLIKRTFALAVIIIFASEMSGCATIQTNQYHSPYQTQQGMISTQVATIAGVSILVGAGLFGLFLLGLPHILDGANLCK